jgi:hypothetical protein
MLRAYRTGRKRCICQYRCGIIEKTSITSATTVKKITKTDLKNM